MAQYFREIAMHVHVMLVACFVLQLCVLIRLGID